MVGNYLTTTLKMSSFCFSSVTFHSFLGLGAIVSFFPMSYASSLHLLYPLKIEMPKTMKNLATGLHFTARPCLKVDKCCLIYGSKIWKLRLTHNFKGEYTNIDANARIVIIFVSSSIQILSYYLPLNPKKNNCEYQIFLYINSPLSYSLMFLPGWY